MLMPFPACAGKLIWLTYLRRGALGGILTTDCSSTAALAIFIGELASYESESIVDASVEEFE